MKKLLKFETNAFITPEYWLNSKLAVMQTSECFDKWLVSHMGMNANEKDVFVLGEIERYSLSYFESILTMSIDLFSISVDEIIPFIIEQIDLENYIILYINVNRFSQQKSDVYMFHEVLVYGYDEEKQVIIATFPVNGVYKKVYVPYDLLKAAYADGFTCLKEHPKGLFARRSFFLPITLLRPEHHYENNNVQYNFVLKLTAELKGKIYSTKNIDSITDQEPKVGFPGLETLHHFSEALRKRAEHSSDESDKSYWRLMGICTGICENHIMIYRSMNWFVDSISDNCEALKTIVDKYELCCQKMEQNVALLLKYKFTHNKQILLKIADNMDMLLAQEPEILENFIREFSAVYSKPSSDSD